VHSDPLNPSLQMHSPLAEQIDEFKHTIELLLQSKDCLIHEKLFLFYLKNKALL
jgi:hypothetical protein